MALIGGAILGTLVGTVIVAQTLYSSTKDHINEFATLRALGSSSGYIHRVILAQAALSAVIGYVARHDPLPWLIVFERAKSPLPIVMTPGLAACCSADGRHVRHLGAVRHRQGHEDRSSRGIQPMTATSHCDHEP